MKKYALQMILGTAILPVFFLFFTQCRSEAGEIAQFDALAADRGGSDYQQKIQCFCLTNQYPAQRLSEKEKEALLFMREEEKLAHDVYTVFSEKWNTQIFTNISGSEQRHMDALLCLITKYKLEDPAGANAPGVFKNAQLQELYNNLIAEGQQLTDALKVGAKIEDLDIFDLMRLRPDIDNADLLAAFDELTRGSRNHIRAFTQNLENWNQTYTPQFISQELFLNIINSPQETGGGFCGSTANKACTGAGKGAGNCSGTPGNRKRGN